MTDTLNTTHRPAKLSPLSDRDLEIFQHAQIHGRTHCAIANDFEISRRRVGQIVHDVRHWLSIHGTDDPVIYSQIQRQRLDRALERMYLKKIIQRAIHGLNNAPPTLTTSTHINDRCVKQVKRDQPPVDSRLLKTYLQAVNSLGKLNERQPFPELPPQPWKHPKIEAVVSHWRELNKEYDFEPQDFDQFAQELTTTIQSCLESGPPQGSPPTPSGTEAEECLNPEGICTTNPAAATPHSELRTPHSPDALPFLPSRKRYPTSHLPPSSTTYPPAHQSLPSTYHSPTPLPTNLPLPSKNPKREAPQLRLSPVPCLPFPVPRPLHLVPN